MLSTFCKAQSINSIDLLKGAYRHERMVLSNQYVLTAQGGIGFNNYLDRSQYFFSITPFYSLSLDKYLFRFPDNNNFNNGCRIGVKFYHNIYRFLGMYTSRPSISLIIQPLKYLNIHLGVQKTLFKRLIVSMDSDFRILQTASGYHPNRIVRFMEVSIAYQINKNTEKTKQKSIFK